MRRKIIGLGLLNVALAVAALFVFGRMHYRLGPESLLVGPARERILAIGAAFRLEMAAGRDPVEVLRGYRARYDADAFLLTPRGEAIAGPSVELPEVVRERMRGGGPGPPREPGPGPREPFFFAISRAPALYWTGIRLPIDSPEGGNVPAVLLLRSATLFNAKLFFDWQPWAALALTLAGISALCWLPFLRGLTTAIAQMDRVTEQIALGRFDGRVADRRADELGHLGAQINRMAARLEAFVQNQKRFLGDTAHELTAPIARIQFALGILEQRVEEKHQRDIAVLHEEIQEMSALVAELLSFSKAGMDPGAAPREPVKAAEAVRRAAAREGVEAQIAVEEDLRVLALERPLLRALGNLLRNAAHYAGTAGPITVSARRERDRVAIVVADEGPGLPPESLEQIFEPFYRPQASRSRDSGGVGLGLAIVKTCVEACHGTVSCRNRTPHGLEVTILLDGA